eukprot:6382303-Alexandrium_andersonii.AAC.1
MSDPTRQHGCKLATRTWQCHTRCRLEGAPRQARRSHTRCHPEGAPRQCHTRCRPGNATQGATRKVHLGKAGKATQGATRK